MTLEKTKLNIYQKLIEVRKSVVFIEKGKKNEHFKFSYVSSSQTLHAIRKKMDEMGLLLSPQIEAAHITQGDKQLLTELYIEYTWINAEDPEETIVCKWYGQGLDTGEKGVGKALTYSEKYFILKYFNIATDKDDPDGHNTTVASRPRATTASKTESTSRPKSSNTAPATEKQVNAIYAIASKDHSFSDQETKEFCENITHFTIKSLHDLSVTQASACIEVLNNKKDVHDILETSGQKSIAGNDHEDGATNPFPDTDEPPF